MAEPTRAERGRGHWTEGFERDRRLHELLARALDQPLAARRTFLAEACPEPDLVAKVLDLLARQGELGDFLEGPPLLAVEVGSGDAHPETIGPYRLLEVLGEGGMGRVFLAEQTGPVERRVALKLIAEALRTGEAVARFAAERQAMARLSHAAIAQIFEAGTTEDGFPYFAMEWVDGPPITAYCDRRGLSLAGRLRLLVEVCRAVEHAHQRQVLHRDLKPGNILVAEVDGKPVPKVIDFGIAKGLDQPLSGATLATGARLIGTPDYMSPEALGITAGGVDTRSDVYSLGLVLYELLAGVRPFEGGDSLGEVLVRRATATTPRPSTRLSGLDEPQRAELARRRGEDPATHRRRLVGDLDWMVMKAIAHDREERYGSPAALADDLERFLADQPISARPPSTAYLVRKLVRRHRTAALAAAVALMALVGGVVGTSLALVRATRAEAQARKEAETASRASSFLTDLFRASDPERFRAGELSARELLASGAEQLRTQLKDEPVVRARLLGTIGTVYRKLELHDEGLTMLRESVELSEANLPPGHREIGLALVRLGALHMDMGHDAEGEPVLRRALALFENAQPPDPLNHAQSLNSLAIVHWNRGDLEQAEVLLRRGAEIAERELGATHPQVSAMLGNLAGLRTVRGDLDEAATLIQRAIDLHLESGRGETSELGHRLLNLGSIQARLGRKAQAEAATRRAYAILEKALGPHHSTTLMALMNLGVQARDQGKLEEAERCFRQALAGQEKQLGMEHARTQDSLLKLSHLLWQRGRLAEAEPLLARRVEVFRRLGADKLEDLRASLGYLGSAREQLGRADEAEPVLREALAAGIRSPGSSDEEDPSLSFAYWGLANLERDRGRAAAAEALYRRAFDLFAQADKRPSWDPPYMPDRERVRADFEALSNAG